MSDVFRIADILVTHAKRAHGDEICIIAYYGSYAKGNASPTSDLDLFYIPDEGKASSLCSQFIIDGLPYDFWPVSWHMAEEIANADSARQWAVSASLIADTKVLYHRSQKDLDRFNALKARIAALIEPASRPYMVKRSLREFKNTLFHLGQMRLADSTGDVSSLRWSGWNLASSAVNCLALVNQTYFNKGWGANIPQILTMAEKPADLEALLEDILVPRDKDVALGSAVRLAKEVRAILRAAQYSIGDKAPVAEVFKDFYFYIFEYRNKTLSACRRKDEVAAASAAFHMQEQICQLMSKIDNGYYPEEYNLLGEYSRGYEQAGFPDLIEPASQGDLDELAARVRLLDDRAREWLTLHSIDLGMVSDQESLRQFLNTRDPVADPAD